MFMNKLNTNCLFLSTEKEILHVTISILYLFNINYVETQLNQSKTSRLHKFVRNGQNTTVKLCKRFFFHKNNKNMQSKPGMKYFEHSRYDVTHAVFKTL